MHLQCSGCGALIAPWHAETCACVPCARRTYVFCPDCWGRAVPPRYRTVSKRPQEVTVWDFPPHSFPMKRPKKPV